MNEQRALRSAARRLRHRSRSVAASVSLAVAAIAAAWIGTESVLAALGRPPLWQSPAGLVRLAQTGGGVTMAVGAAVAIAGIVLVAIAVTPGRLHRRELADDRAVWVIDDDLLAAAVSRTTARTAGVGLAQVRTALGRRSAVTRVRPASGFRPDAGAIRQAAASIIDDIAPSPRPNPRIVIEKQGVLS